MNKGFIIIVVLFLALTGGIVAQEGMFDGEMVRRVNLLPQVPWVGCEAGFAAEISTAYRNSKLTALFRSSNNTFSIPLFDDGAHADGSPGDGIYGGTFPAQQNPGYWFCSVSSQSSGGGQKFSIPQVFAVTPLRTEYRALWADSWNRGFLSEGEARRMIETCRESNINAIIVEIRKMGDAYYDSTYEPRATNIRGSSYDPLKYIIEQAHDTSGGKKRIEVHAWIVVYRAYKGGGKPSSPKHVMNAHPEWISQSESGAIQDNGSTYLDPGVPAVTDYTIDICRDIISKYDVDGINFDYIRYPSSGWGYNPIAVKRFQKLYNVSEKPDSSDPRWKDFLRDQVSHFLRKAYVNLIKEKPELKVSVCTIGWGDIPGGRFEDAEPYSGGIQDWARWNRNHLMDINFRMGYKRHHEPKQKLQFERWTDFTLNNQCFRISPIGIGAYLNSREGTIEQILHSRRWGANGMVFYSYASSSMNQNEKISGYQAISRKTFPTWCEVPSLAWKVTSPTGIVAGVVLKDGKAADGSEVSISEINIKTITDGTGFYAFMDVPPGSWKIALDGTPTGEVNVSTGKVNEFNIR